MAPSAAIITMLLGVLNIITIMICIKLCAFSHLSTMWPIFKFESHTHKQANHAIASIVAIEMFVSNAHILTDVVTILSSQISFARQSEVYERNARIMGCLLDKKLSRSTP